MAPITYIFFHYMVPLPDAVKAEIGKCGSEKRDYRYLWWFGEIVHNLLLYRRGKKREKKLIGLLLLLGEGLFVVSPESGFLGDLMRFLIAYLLNTVVSVAVKRGCLYHTESDCKVMRSGPALVNGRKSAVGNWQRW
jgi:hypothetical protein